MDYSKDVNRIPYEEYGNLVFTNILIVIRINYDDGYVIVSDQNGQLWKVTCDKDDTTLTIAVLTKVQNG